MEHLNNKPLKPSRVVIMGAGSFVGSNAAVKLKQDNINVLGLGREEVDLLDDNAANILADYLKAEDTLLVISALAPCKDNDMLVDNLLMMQQVCHALERTSVSHVIYISSDAVYSDSDKPLAESSPTAPTSIHGMMHIARELMLSTTLENKIPLAILRPSLLYGVDDPHNGYGPNQFRRLAVKGEDIKLFGEGEERRDHVFIEDLAEVIRLVALYKSTGVLNVATGEVISFHDIAQLVVDQFDSDITIKSSPRNGPMPHNGYRAFDIKQCQTSFPEFRFTSTLDGTNRVHQQMQEAH